CLPETPLPEVQANAKDVTPQFASIEVVFVLECVRVTREAKRPDDEAAALRRAGRKGSREIVDVDMVGALEDEPANLGCFALFVARALGVESRGQTRRQQ